MRDFWIYRAKHFGAKWHVAETLTEFEHARAKGLVHEHFHVGEKVESRKNVAIYSGGDWNDASVSILSVPKDTDLEAMKLKYDHWYQTDYREKRVSFLSFSEWLVEFHGASHDHGVEEFHN